MLELFHFEEFVKFRNNPRSTSQLRDNEISFAVQHRPKARGLLIDQIKHQEGVIRMPRFFFEMPSVQLIIQGIDERSVPKNLVIN